MLCYNIVSLKDLPDVSFSYYVALCVVGNKIDLSAERRVRRESGEEFAHQIGAMYTETSAAENIGKQLSLCQPGTLAPLRFFNVYKEKRGI